MVLARRSLEYMRDMAIEWMAYYAGVANQEYGLSIKQGLEQSVPLVTGLMRPILSQIDPLEVGSYRRALAIAQEYGKRMLALVGATDDDLVHELVWEYPAHSFCIDYEEADRLGLPVERLSSDHDKRFAEAITKLERGYYHGFASTGAHQAALPKKSSAPTVVSGKRAAKDGRASSGGDNGSSDRVGEGKSAKPQADNVQNESDQAS